MAAIELFRQYITNSVNTEAFIGRLTEAISYKSVSADANPGGVLAMRGWLKQKLEEQGVTVSIPNDSPPYVLLGQIGTHSQKKTVLVYSHYDVMPVDGWKGPGEGTPEERAFKLYRQDGKMYGRGTTDDKGPVTGWINVLEAHKKQDLELPVNMRFLFEGNEEKGSPGLDEFIKAEVEKGDNSFFHTVDCVCVTDNYWLTTRRPVLTYGVRGIAYFTMNIKGAADDLHSGIYGRMIHEPMTDMVKLLSKLVEPNGEISVPGVEIQVPPPTEAEREEYELMDYRVADLRIDTGGRAVELSEKTADLLMGRMRFPSLSIHGIKGTFDAPTGLKTIIPCDITARFSLRLVDPLTPVNIQPIVIGFLNSEFRKLNSKNEMKVTYEGGGFPWVGNRNHYNYRAAEAATEVVYGSSLKPDYTREGGSIPVSLTFSDLLGKNVLLLPMGQSDDGAHTTLEKLDEDNYTKGTRLYGEYLYALANSQ